MLTLTQINLFPIKSLGGIRVGSVALTNRGLQYDRRWMLVDSKGNFLTQRTLPVMSQLQVSLQPDNLVVTDRREHGAPLTVPMLLNGENRIRATVFGDTCDAWSYSTTINSWFTRRLGVDCRLVYMPDDADRPVDKAFRRNQEQVSFADGFPALIIGESSLGDLNARLDAPVTMDRFRPNLVFSGGEPFAEDLWRHVKIGEAEFYGVKLCARCVLTTVDPVTSQVGPEPLKTLATYRKQERGVMFGQNLLHGSDGEIAVGDRIEVLESSH